MALNDVREAAEREMAARRARADRARAELSEIDAKLDVAARRHPHSRPATADAHVITKIERLLGFSCPNVGA